MPLEHSLGPHLPQPIQHDICTLINRQLAERDMHHQYAHAKMAPTFSEFSFFKAVIEKKTSCKKHSVPKNYFKRAKFISRNAMFNELEMEKFENFTRSRNVLGYFVQKKTSHGSLKNGWKNTFRGPEISLGVLRNAHLRGLNVWFYCALSVDILHLRQRWL